MNRQTERTNKRTNEKRQKKTSTDSYPKRPQKIIKQIGAEKGDENVIKNDISAVTPSTR